MSIDRKANKKLKKIYINLLQYKKKKKNNQEKSLEVIRKENEKNIKKIR